MATTSTNADDVRAPAAVPEVEDQPRPGVLGVPPRTWKPLIDGRTTSWQFGMSVVFHSREDALDDAFERIRLGAGVALRGRFGQAMGRYSHGRLGSDVVEDVTEARRVIVRFARSRIPDLAYVPGPGQRLHLWNDSGLPTWDDLEGCKVGARYRPDAHHPKMTCDYLVYEGSRAGDAGAARQERARRSGADRDYTWNGRIVVRIEAPPEVWDHPADEPINFHLLPDDDEGGDRHA